MRRLGFILVSIIVSFACTTLASAATAFLDPQYDVRETQAIVYGTGEIAGGSTPLRLDLYEPSGASAPRLRPGFIAMHRGISLGHRREADMRRLCTEFASRGFVCISIDYRLHWSRPVIGNAYQRLFDDLGGDSSPRAQRLVPAVEDANLAYDWMVAHAAALGLDPGRIAVGGTSTGASAALYLAYAQDDSGVPSRRLGLVVDLWGALYDETDRIETGEPPLIVIHGEQDQLVPFDHADAMRERANKAHVPIDFLKINDARHGMVAVPIFTQLDDDEEKTLLERIVSNLFDALDLDGLPSGPVTALAPGSYRLELDWADTTRTLLLFIPSKYSVAEKLPLLLGLHGGYDDAEGFAARNGWLAKAEAEGFIAVVPDGTGAVRTWNAAHCCGAAFILDVSDSEFLRALVDLLRAELKVDPARVYVTGHSNGAMMAHRLAAEHPEIIAGIAPVGGSIGGIPFIGGPLLLPTIPALPVPAFMVHGLLDPNVPFGGGQGSGPGAAIGRIDEPAMESFRFWASANHADTMKAESSRDNELITIVARGDASAPETRLAVVVQGGHGWEGAWNDPTPSSINMTDLVWSFLSSQRKPDPRF